MLISMILLRELNRIQINSKAVIAKLRVVCIIFDAPGPSPFGKTSTSVQYVFYSPG